MSVRDRWPQDNGASALLLFDYPPYSESMPSEGSPDDLSPIWEVQDTPAGGLAKIVPPVGATKIQGLHHLR